VMAIERVLAELEGVASASADLESKLVTVEWESPASWDSISARLREVNYAPEE
jgi:copper chaperone